MPSSRLQQRTKRCRCWQVRCGIDLLFSDVVMPGRLSGVDLAREAHRLRPALPVVLTTGYSEAVAQVEGVRVLAKPYRIDELVHLLDAVLTETGCAAKTI